MLFLIELKRWSGLSPLTATLEQLPSTGLFFFEQISYYDFPIKFRWISFEVILFLFFVFRKLVSKENSIIGKRLGNSLIFMTLLALSALSLFAIKFERNSNPHQWYLVFVIFILYYLAENILKFKKGRIILILLTIWSFAFNLIMQLELSRSRTSHGYYMTTLGERLDLLQNLCVRDLNRVNVISTPNSKIAWDFLIKKDSCLKPTDSVTNADVIINERLFPWKQSSLKIDKILNKEEWFSGELWTKRK